MTAPIQTGLVFFAVALVVAEGNRKETLITPQEVCIDWMSYLPAPGKSIGQEREYKRERKSRTEGSTSTHTRESTSPERVNTSQKRASTSEKRKSRSQKSSSLIAKGANGVPGTVNVHANIYDVGGVGRFKNKVLEKFGPGGAFHVGVQVSQDGHKTQEYAFGGEGIYTTPEPKNDKNHLFRESRFICWATAYRDVGLPGINSIVQQMKHKFAESGPNAYNLLSNNCQSFASALITILCGGEQDDLLADITQLTKWAQDPANLKNIRLAAQFANKFHSS